MNSMKTLVLCLTATIWLTGSHQANATVITQWDFNYPEVSGDIRDADTSETGAPSVGEGALQAIGGTSVNFREGGSSNDQGTPNRHFRLHGWPDQGQDVNTAGWMLSADTTGRQDIVVSWDMRHTRGTSRFFMAQFSVDGETFIDAALIHVYHREFWYSYEVDLSEFEAVNDNPDFQFRLVATFAPAVDHPLLNWSGNEYEGTSLATGYTGGGSQQRLDMLTVQGTPIASVPEPTTMSLLGVCGAALLMRRGRGSGRARSLLHSCASNTRPA